MVFLEFVGKKRKMMVWVRPAVVLKETIILSYLVNK